jgi:hypothetical protein
MITNTRSAPGVLVEVPAKSNTLFGKIDIETPPERTVVAPQ